MSKFANQILQDIKTNPNNWYKIPHGISNGSIKIDCIGNTKLLSILDISVNGKDIPTTWLDRYRIEGVFYWWCENVDLNHLSK